jgi:hypothetical protein
MIAEILEVKIYGEYVQHREIANDINCKKKYGDYRLSSLIFNEKGSRLMQIATCIFYRCSTCGNIQSFLKETPEK